jgi:putative ABC transport system substrate-binding protein
MRRREFIGLFGGAAAFGVSRPHTARAQAGQPVIGVLNAGAPAVATYFAGLRQGLKEAGYVEGQNFTFEARWAEGQYDRLPSMATELVRRPVAVIVASGLPPIFAAKAATSTIPIVFMSAGDPVQLGIVASLNRPGGNLTGVSFLGVELVSKRLELLLEAVPGANVIGALLNPDNPRTATEAADLQAAARRIGKQMVVAEAASERDFDAAFATLVQGRAGALLVSGEPLFTARRQQLLALAARHALPVMCDYREFTADGGLLSYGFSLTNTYRLLAGQVARILKGASPADLPVLQPTKFELVVNLRTAKALGLAISESFLLRADEVIE